ncbi:MAG: class I SAM-dependent methyltransferase [Pseudomonadota bacterium]
MTAIPEQHAAHTAVTQAAKKTSCRCSASRFLDAEHWNQRYAAPGFLWTAGASRLLMSEVADLAPGRALDLAAGEGRNAVWLAEQGWTVEAVDFSDRALAKAQGLAAARQVAERVRCHPADLRDYQPEARAFDLVLLFYLQLPQAELVPILRRAARAVAPGGTLLLIGHDATNPKQGYGGPRHRALLYDAGQVVAALGDELRIEQAGRVEREVKTAEGLRIALDCRVRGLRP